jgi:predicted RNase H-like HicB family nuclease
MAASTIPISSADCQELARRRAAVTPQANSPTASQFTLIGRIACPGSVRSPASTRLALDLGRTCQQELRYAALMSEAAPTLHLTAVVTREGDWYVARCLEIEAVSQGETVEQALANLRDVVEVYLEEEGAPPSSGQASPLVTSFDVPIPA